jgi:hypothetical protein
VEERTYIPHLDYLRSCQFVYYRAVPGDVSTAKMARILYETGLNIIRLSGSDSSRFSDWKDAKERVIALAGQYEATRVLVDASDQTSPADITNFYIFSTSLPRYLRTAVVVAKSAVREKHRFISEIAENHDLPVRHFAPETDALTWLFD